MRAALLALVALGLFACGGNGESSTGGNGGGTACTSGQAPPAGDFCFPCNEIVCACSGQTAEAEGISTCAADGQSYGECVLPNGAGTCPASPCGIVPECHTGCTDKECCNVTAGKATLASCEGS